MKTLSVYIALPLLWIACRSYRSEPTAISDREYVIYSTLIDTLIHNTSIEIALISDSTLRIAPMVPESDQTGLVKVLKFQDWGPGSYSPRLNDSVSQSWTGFDFHGCYSMFEISNQVASPVIADSIKVDVEVRLNRWKSMRNSPYSQQYEGGKVGLFWFSRVGFDSTKTEALIYCEHSFGYLNGYGSWYCMTFLGGHWIIARSCVTWVS